jgi:hypothetical protein
MGAWAFVYSATLFTLSLFSLSFEHSLLSPCLLHSLPFPHTIPLPFPTHVESLITSPTLYSVQSFPLYNFQHLFSSRCIHFCLHSLPSYRFNLTRYIVESLSPHTTPHTLISTHPPTPVHSLSYISTQSDIVVLHLPHVISYPISMHIFVHPYTLFQNNIIQHSHSHTHTHASLSLWLDGV